MLVEHLFCLVMTVVPASARPGKTYCWRTNLKVEEPVSHSLSYGTEREKMKERGNAKNREGHTMLQRWISVTGPLIALSRHVCNRLCDRGIGCRPGLLRFGLDERYELRLELLNQAHPSAVILAVGTKILRDFIVSLFLSHLMIPGILFRQGDIS